MVIHEGLRDYWASYLRRQPHAIYAVLDAAHGPDVLKLVHDAVSYESLFAGDELADVAPYVIAVPRDRLEKTIAKMWGKSWGVFFTSSYPLTAVHRHLQRMMEAETEHGEHYMFRFYDPRVLRAIVPVCTGEEIDELLGPIERFVIEGKVATAALEVERARTAAVGVARVILRRAHLEALERLAHDVWIDRLVEHTRADRGLVEAAVMWAEEAGLETESEVVAYVEMRLAKGDL